MIILETIGIVAAMSQERDALLRTIDGWEHLSLGPYRCPRFRLLNRDCLLITSGMGINRAAQATRALIDAFHPKLLVSVGVAGAVHANLDIGDVVVSRNACLLEKGRPGLFQPLALPSEAAWQAAGEALKPRRAQLYFGTAVTTHGSQLIQPQPAELTNPVLEMETYGIAQVAAELGIPLLSLRAISDGPRAPIPFDLEVMMDEQDNLRMGKMLKTILGHPQMLPQLLQMGRNTTMAAQNAAIALVAILSQPGELILQG
jgi:adenosylhomocysteine nucleosidase